MIVSYKVNLSDFALRSMYDYKHDHETGMVQKIFLIKDGS